MTDEDPAPDRAFEEWRALPMAEQLARIAALAEAADAEARAAAGQPRPPGLMAKAGGFASAAVAHVAGGRRIAPDDVRAARKAQCDACPHLAPPGDSCLLCGCNLALKRSWAVSGCPDSPPRWGPA